ncbi:hypothetical protein [Rhizobium sp. C104]|nr:hypothetical protein [Rhizobium sp. C104]
MNGSVFAIILKYRALPTTCSSERPPRNVMRLARNVGAFGL